MVLVVLLAACAQTADYERPALPVPPQWPQGSDAAGQQVAAQLQWRHYFVDPRLQVLIATALDNNRDLRIATQRVLEARAQYRITDADRFPSINLAGSLQAGQTPADLSGTGTVINGQRFDLALTNVAYEAPFCFTMTTAATGASGTVEVQALSLARARTRCSAIAASKPARSSASPPTHRRAWPV